MAITGRAGSRPRFFRSVRKEVIGTFTAPAMRLAFHSLWVRTSRINGAASLPSFACNSSGEISGTFPKGIHQNLLRQAIGVPCPRKKHKSAVSLYEPTRLTVNHTANLRIARVPRSLIPHLFLNKPTPSIVPSMDCRYPQHRRISCLERLQANHGRHPPGIQAGS